MKRVKFPVEGKSSFTTAQECRVDVQAGELEGMLELVPFVDSELCSRDEGFFRVFLVFKASTGEELEYSSILPFRVLWPPDDITCERSKGLSEADLSLYTVLDSRNDYKVSLTDGTTISGFMKHVDSRVQVLIQASRLDVRLTFYSTQLIDYCTVAYQLPLSSVMWRKAPVFFADDINPQGADYVDIKKREPEGVDVRPSSVVVRQQHS